MCGAQPGPLCLQAQRARGQPAAEYRLEDILKSVKLKKIDVMAVSQCPPTRFSTLRRRAGDRSAGRDYRVYS